MGLQKVVIAGGGPVGSLLAVLLAKQGYSSQVFERRTKPERNPSKNDSQAYLLNANLRSITTFRENGISIDALLDRSGGYLKQLFMRPDGKPYHNVEAAVSLEKPTMMRVFRDEIARHLIDEAERLYPDKITFHFEEGITGIDLQKKVVTVSGKTATKEVKYDLLVGADGAGSKVRSAIQQQSGPDYLKRRGHDTVYTTGPCSAPDGVFPKHTLFYLHAIEAGAVMVNGRGDGDVRVALFLPKDLADQVSAGDKAFIREQVEKGTPGLNDYARKAVLNIIDNPGAFHPISGWTYLSSLYGPSTLLVGDAAHTMTPMLGQGCNSGLEDTRLFVESLKKHPDDLEAALKDYNALRLPDIQALLKLNEIAANERHLILGSGSLLLHKIWVKSHAGMLTIHQGLRRSLHKLLPSVFGPPTLTNALMGKIPYRRVLPAMYRDTFLVACATILTATGLFKAAKFTLARVEQPN